MKRKAVILAAGEFPRKPYPLFLLEAADIIVCCDSAAEGFRRHFGERRLPDAVIGDMDSIPRPLQVLYADRLVPVAEQDDNDQTKALNYLLAHYDDLDEVVILGATGKREDHTIGNLSLLMEYARTRGIDGLSSPSVRTVSDYSEAFAILDSCTLFVGQGRDISVFSPDNSLRIRSQGLEWPLNDVVWDNWWKATLNRSTADAVTLTLSHPAPVLILLPA